jgi:hypothetical protein
MQDFRNLKVWEKAHILTLDVYRVSKIFPREEMYGLTSQLRRASVSIAANIAEGSCRKGMLTLPDFCRWPRDRRAKWSITCCWREIWSC